MRAVVLVVAACGRLHFMPLIDNDAELIVNDDAPRTLGNAVSGGYVGDGTAPRAINIGFAPGLVVLRNGNNSGTTVFATTNMPAGSARDVPFPTGPFVTNEIDGLTATGFTVGNNFATNLSGTTFYWAGWPSSPNTLIGTYSGTGVTQTIDIGFKPDWLWVFTDGEMPVQRFALDPTTDDAGGFNTVQGGPGIITSLDPTGFVVGTSTDSNASGATYYYVAFRATAGFAAMATFPGTAAPQTFTGLGFTPELVFVVDLTYTGVQFHWYAMGPSTDATCFAGGGSPCGPDGITSLSADGFSIGATCTIVGHIYAYAAFAR
jgi:hypothetical protein